LHIYIYIYIYIYIASPSTTHNEDMAYAPKGQKLYVMMACGLPHRLQKCM
jgi:hypothetical protein